MSLQTDKRELNTKLSRYMTLLSNLSSPPAEYINDVDYLRGLVQIADQKEFQDLEQTWETIRPKDARSARYIETGVLNGGRAVELKGLLTLADDILALRGGPTSGNWAHDGRPGKKGGSGRGGGFKRLRLAKGTTSRRDVKAVSRRVRKKRKQLKDKGLPPGGRPATKAPDKKKDVPIKTKPGTGKKVSDGLNLAKLPKRGKVGPDVRSAIDIINSVHSDGDLPTIPVKSSSAKRFLGVYKHSLFGGKAVEIGISTRGNHPRMTAAHEVGHFLDHQGMGKPGKFSNTSQGWGTTEKDKRARVKAEALYKVIGESSAINSLKNDVPKQKVKVEYVINSRTGEKRSYTYPADRKYINYLLEPHEQFARAYSQYITAKSDDPKMKTELNETRKDKGKKNKIYYHEQWDDNDFKPIAKAFDDLFLELDWVKGE